MNNNYLRLHYTMKPPLVCFNTRVGITTTLLVLLTLCFNINAQISVTGSLKINLDSYLTEDIITDDNPKDIGVGDFNGDGKQDIVVANPLFYYFSIYYRNEDNTGFDPAVNLGYDSYLFPTPGDFNADGKTDIALTNPGSGLISVFLRNEDNTDFNEPLEYSVGSNPQKLVAADFNGDGRLDIACTNYASSSPFLLEWHISILYWNIDNGDFDPEVTVQCGKQPSSIVAADFNNDGKSDFAITCYGDNLLSVYLRDTANSGFLAPISIPGVSQPKCLVAADFDGDEKIDIATANYGSNNISVFFRNSSNTDFDLPVNYGVGTHPYYIVAADFNSDGKADLASVNFDSGSMSMFLRHPSNHSFKPKLDFPTGNFPVFLAVGDFNTDGRTDIAVNLNSTKVVLFTNNSKHDNILDSLLNSNQRIGSNDASLNNSNHNVFPNPFNDHISFLIKTKTEENVNIKIQDIHGKTLLSGKYKTNQVNTIRENLSAGQYILIANYSTTSKAFRVYKAQ